VTIPLPATAGFAELLRHILILEKQQPLKQVAAALGMTVHAFCARLRNGGRLDPDDVAILLREVADERLLRWFFAGSGLLLVKHTIVLPGGSNMTLLERVVTCAVGAIAAICDLADTMESGTPNGQQKAMIEERLDHAQAALLSIKLHLAPPLARSPAGRAVTPDGAVHEDFPHLVSRVVMTDNGIRAQPLADALNISYQALHARLSGRVGFLPRELRQLFRTFPDPRLADYLLIGTGCTAVLRPAVIESHDPSGPIRTGLLSLREMVEFLEVVLLTEDAPGSAVAAHADRHLDEAVRQLATLQWNLAYIGHHDDHRNDPFRSGGAMSHGRVARGLQLTPPGPHS
jgi:hypothetical protein